MRLPTRREVPLQDQWSLETVYADEAAWRVALQALTGSGARLAPFAGRLAESGAVLWQALQLRDQLQAEARKVTMYAGLLSAVDAGDAAYTRMVGESGSAANGVYSAMAFVEPELVAISDTRLAELLNEEPRLALYRHHIASVRKLGAHVRSGEIETLLAQAGDPLGAISATAYAAMYADMKFAPVARGEESVPVSHTTIGALGDDPRTSHAAWESFADGLRSMENTLAAAWQGVIKTTAFMARVRGYGSGIEMSLAQNHVPLSVFDSLIAVFQRNLPTWHRYWRIRQRALGGRQRNSDAPVYESPSALGGNIALTFAQAGDLICEGMAPLGERYVGPMRKGLREGRWVDRISNQGKSGGAFSDGMQGSPPFIFMHWSDSLGAMSTLAHELGHSMHSYLTNQTQPWVYTGYGLFVAEVASNFNQAMVRAHMLKHAKSAAEKLSILDEAFGNFHRYLFVMPQLAMFEREMHARVEGGGAITADQLSSRFVEIFSAGYGGAMEIDAPRLGAGWMGFSHLHAPFYVYQYCTGIAAANALAAQVLEEGEPAARRVLAFLSAGASEYPLDVLKKAGIDMSTPAPLERGFGMLAKLVDELEAAVG